MLHLQVVRKECERDFSVARTTDVKLVDDVLIAVFVKLAALGIVAFGTFTLLMGSMARPVSGSICGQKIVDAMCPLIIVALRTLRGMIKF